MRAELDEANEALSNLLGARSPGKIRGPRMKREVEVDEGESSGGEESDQHNDSMKTKSVAKKKLKHKKGAYS